MSGPSQVLSGWVALDGPVARTALLCWYAFVVSVCFLLAFAPYLLFERLVGWQPSHLAIWLGAVSLAPAGPATCGLLGAMRVLVGDREYPGRPVRQFVGAVRAGARRLRPWWWAVPAAALFLGYDAVLYRDAVPSAPAFVAVVGVLITVLLVGVTVVAGGDAGADAGTVADADADAAAGGTAGLRSAAHATLSSFLRRPLVPLAWLALLVGAVLLTRLPVVGPSLVLFAPAGWAGAVDVVNRAWGFPAPSPRVPAGPVPGDRADAESERAR
ncbi:hypothetical protein L1785_15935 [Antribacter sp. KLBMP9083]|uniref:Uncharacterized protein n=1 Tax=Antribacter soli TaxID=2910976 RepID=A0AA41QHZ0_9MICO|nr:hypothetical protein [Antribacter soli]MCF4122469.1 hypothetical protein [Antribacter soli]